MSKKKLALERQRSQSVDYGMPHSNVSKSLLDKRDEDGKREKTYGRRPSKQPEFTEEYTVKEGDTLASIAVKSGCELSLLKQVNRFVDPVLIYAGMKIYIPTAEYLASRYDKKLSVPVVTVNTLTVPSSNEVKEIKYSRPRRASIAVTNYISNKIKSKKRSDSGAKVRSDSPTVETISLQASYLIGEKKGECWEGTMMVTPSEFWFIPNDASDEEGRKIREIVSYRMSLGEILKSAKFYKVNPVNLDRVDTKLYLSAMNHDDSAHSSHVTLNNSDESSQPQRHSRHSSYDSHESVGITFSVRARADASGTHESSKQDVSVPSDASTKNDSLSTENKSLSDQTKRTTDEQTSAKNLGEVKEKKGVHDKSHKVHFTADDEDKLNRSNIERAAEAVANAVITDATAALAPPDADVTYLRVKLGQKEKPTLNSLIQSSLGFLGMPPSNTSDQPQSWTRHCFAISLDSRAEELSDFLTRYYPDQLCKKHLELKEKIDRKITDDKRILRRNLSVLEVCRLPLPTMSENSHLLSEVQIKILCEHLIVSADCRPWLLAYSTDRHGFSLQTLYRNCSELDTASLVVVQDTNDQVFGAMLPNSPKMSEGYYGNGEAFLFKFNPVFKKYVWAGKNHYIANGAVRNFSVGGGAGQFGLWFDDDLRRGRTERCETFDNEPLSDSTDFLIKAVEIWLFPFSLDT